MGKNLKKSIYDFAAHQKLTQHCKSTVFNLKRGFVWVYVLISLGCISRVELLYQTVDSVLTFWASAPLFSKVAAPFCIPTSSIWGSQFLTSWPTLVITCLFVYSCIVSVHGVSLKFWFSFLWRLMMLTIFSCAYWPFTYLWENVYSDPLPIF